MNTEKTYQFEASYCYGPEERYNAGRGLHASGLDEEEALDLFDLYVNRGENYALEIRSAGRVLRKHGPSMQEASNSMNAAWRRRYGHRAQRDDLLSEVEKAKTAMAALIAALRLVEELSFNALDHAHPRNSGSISAIWRAAHAAIAKL